MSLKEYKAKRNFRQTREPAGLPRRKDDDPSKHFFVVQKHDATRLHYDFRLAMEGVLKSWAVPKGFPVKKGDRRLAVQVEDHPMDYARFEGTIPEGNYGAGTVMVWDIGSYEVGGGDPVKALAEGKLHLFLKGKKLKDEWTLVRMRQRENEDKPQWLLLKSGSDIPPISARTDDRSALTGRSLKQIAVDNDAQWQSDRMAEQVKTRSHTTRKPKSSKPGRRGNGKSTDLGVSQKSLPGRKAAFVEPTKALLKDELPKGSDWIYELKFDGIRALAIKSNRKTTLLSRNEKDLTVRFPELTEAVAQLPCQETVLDGEVVALDAEGKSSFQLLQSANLPGQSKPDIFYYVFDLIQLNGHDVTRLPLLERKALLQKLVEHASNPIRFSAAIGANAERVIKEMKARGLEGLIAKRKESTYEIGRRSGAWVKFKWTNEQEFVIGGFTPPRGTRKHFGAILVGYHERGQLKFASKVGSGFDQKLLKSLYDRFKKLIRSDCPFTNLPERNPSRWGRALTAAEMKRCTWLKPELVCQVRFAEWTRDGHLRQPTFLGLREDKNPQEVVREKSG